MEVLERLTPYVELVHLLLNKMCIRDSAHGASHFT